MTQIHTHLASLGGRGKTYEATAGSRWWLGRPQKPWVAQGEASSLAAWGRGQVSMTPHPGVPNSPSHSLRTQSRKKGQMRYEGQTRAPGPLWNLNPLASTGCSYEGTRSQGTFPVSNPVSRAWVSAALLVSRIPPFCE